MGAVQPGYRRKAISAIGRQFEYRSRRLPRGRCRAGGWGWRCWAACVFAVLALCPIAARAVESVALTIRVVVLPASAFLAVPTLTVLPLPVLDAPLTKVPLARLPASQRPLQMVLTVASAAASGHPYFTRQTGAALPYSLSLDGVPLRFPSGGSLVVVPSRVGGLLTLSTSAAIPADARDTVALTLRVN